MFLDLFDILVYFCYSRGRDSVNEDFIQFIEALLSAITHIPIPLIKGKWQQMFLSSHLKETLKQYMEAYYRIFRSALFREIFSFEIFSFPPSWIFVDMHDTSQLGLRDSFSYDTMVNLLQ